MRIKPRKTSDDATGDLTPMIDMTFQLIAFFMVLINFSEADQDQRVQLPLSVIAKPPEAPLDNPIYIHMQEDGGVIFAGEDLSLEGLGVYLDREREILALNNKTADQATVIIRADGGAKTGRVQELIQVCQEKKFEKFALRAKEEVGY